VQAREKDGGREGLGRGERESARARERERERESQRRESERARESARERESIASALTCRDSQLQKIKIEKECINVTASVPPRLWAYNNMPI
jgi:hypothetical protein